MKDDYPVPSGTKGIVDFIDDAGQNWNNGSSLTLIYGVGDFETIKNKERER